MATAISRGRRCTSSIAWSEWLLHAHTRGVGWVGLSVPLAEAWLHELLAEPTRLQDAGENALASLS
jgi:hypothetical protein